MNQKNGIVAEGKAEIKGYKVERGRLQKKHVPMNPNEESH